MATASEILTLIKRGTSHQLECLAEETTLDVIAETLVAFANGSGGSVVMGVQNKQVVGVSDKFLASSILLEAAIATEPPLIVALPHMLTVQGKALVWLHIPSGMPYVYAYDGRYLFRHGIDNITLNPHELRRLMMERGDFYFEANVAHTATIDDMDWDKARDYANHSGFAEDDVQQVLLKRGCLIQQSGELFPTNAGILLFGRDPQRHIIGSDISAVRFASATMSDTFNRQDIGGTLPDQIRRAATFLVDHLRKEVTLKNRMQHEETYEYPMEAARELVVNAVAHRDYSIHGDNIRILVFSNRMEVHSPGRLPGPMTLQNLKDERFSRNPIIVQVLSDMAFIEKLGYGVDRVIDLMKAQNLREPHFRERGGGFTVVLHNATARFTVSPIEPEQPESEFPNLRFGGRYQGHDINVRQEAALVYLIDEDNLRITNSDLQALFPDVHSETIRRDLADLVTKDILIKMGQKRGSYYMLKERALDGEEL